jgi:tetratricopeptide (TPR) repeat protein
VGDSGADTAAARERARAALEREDFEAALQGAEAALTAAPRDAELLLAAGRAALELDREEAVDLLRRATDEAPGEAAGWHLLGEAYAAEGDTAEAEAAFRRAVELDPEDRVALAHLGHTALASGRSEEGVDLLARAADSPEGSSAVLSLVDMYRSMGQDAEALAQARKLTAAEPDDVLAWLDVAELSLAVGELDDARAAFERVRELDDVPGREGYPLHGMMRVEIDRQDWAGAQRLAAQAAAIDARGLSTEVAAFLAAEQGEQDREQAPKREQVESSLAASLAEYRRILADDRRLAAGQRLV